MMGLNYTKGKAKEIGRLRDIASMVWGINDFTEVQKTLDKFLIDEGLATENKRSI